MQTDAMCVQHLSELSVWMNGPQGVLLWQLSPRLEKPHLWRVLTGRLLGIALMRGKPLLPVTLAFCLSFCVCMLGCSWSVCTCDSLKGFLCDDQKNQFPFFIVIMFSSTYVCSFFYTLISKEGMLFLLTSCKHWEVTKGHCHLVSCFFVTPGRDFHH